VESRSFAPRQGAVSHFPEEDVAEGHRSPPRPPDEIAVRERIDCGLDVLLRQARLERRQGLGLEGSAQDRPQLDDPPRVRLQGVEAGEDRQVHRIRQRGDRARDRCRIGARAEAIDERTDDLAGVERVALGAIDDRGDDLGRGLIEEIGDELCHRLLGQWLERNRDGVSSSAAPGRPPVEQLGPGKRDHQQRYLRPGLQDRLNEVQQAVARPVQVLDHEHDRDPSRRELDESPPGPKERDPVGRLDLAGADRGRQLLRRPFGLGIAGGAQPDVERVANCLRARVIDQTDQRQEDRPHRPIREALTVRQALGDGDLRARIEPVKELLEQPRLPHPGRGHDADEIGPALLEGTARSQVELLEVGLATDDSVAARSAA
jgi:hypothetical protein